MWYKFKDMSFTVLAGLSTRKNFWQGQNSDKNVVLEFRHGETKIQNFTFRTKFKY